MGLDWIGMVSDGIGLGSDGFALGLHRTRIKFVGIALGSDGVDLGAASVKGGREMGGKGEPSWGTRSARAGEPDPPS